MTAYDAYLSGRMEDHELPKESIQKALADIETYPVPAG
jgi:hypothetical protein